MLMLCRTWSGKCIWTGACQHSQPPSALTLTVCHSAHTELRASQSPPFCTGRLQLCIVLSRCTSCQDVAHSPVSCAEHLQGSWCSMFWLAWLCRWPSLMHHLIVCASDVSSHNLAKEIHQPAWHQVFISWLSLTDNWWLMQLLELGKYTVSGNFGNTGRNALR